MSTPIVDPKSKKALSKSASNDTQSHKEENLKVCETEIILQKKRLHICARNLNWF